MVANAGVYGMRKLAKLGVIISRDAVTDGAATVIAEMGDIVIDITDGEIHMVDSGTLTQTLTY